MSGGSSAGFGTGFGARPEELDAAAVRFDEASRQVADALAALRSTLGRLDAAGYLGTDEQGRQFAAAYGPKVAEGFTAIGSEAAALHSLGDALRSSAREYAASDRDSAAPLRPPGG